MVGRTCSPPLLVPVFVLVPICPHSSLVLVRTCPPSCLLTLVPAPAHTCSCSYLPVLVPACAHSCSCLSVLVSTRACVTHSCVRVCLPVLVPDLHWCLLMLGRCGRWLWLWMRGCGDVVVVVVSGGGGDVASTRT